MKTRAAFIFKVVPSLRMARSICADILNLRRAARKPFSLNIPLFKHECMFAIDIFFKQKKILI